MLPILLGGALALVGGIAATLLTHILNVKRETRNLRRERAELLVRAVYSHSAWLEAKQIALFNRVDHDEPSPLDEAQMLQGLYFPTLSSRITALMQAQLPMMQFLLDQRVARLRDERGWAANFDSAPYMDAYRTYLAAISVLVDDVRDLIEK